jgi:hypothetical protein
VPPIFSVSQQIFENIFDCRQIVGYLSMAR